jgi:hypothetical protein
MRTNLRNGRFIRPPTSIAEASARRATLAVEVERIESQLGDKDRMVKHASKVLYDRWRVSAVSAARLYKKEERLLLLWINLAQNELLRRCYDILRTTDERDLEPDELTTLRRLEQLYAPTVAVTNASSTT